MNLYVHVFFRRVIYKLLASKSEGIRVQTLKVMGYFLKHLPPKYVQKDKQESTNLATILPSYF